MTFFHPTDRESGVRRGAATAGAILVVALLGGCSSTPDWANPVEWYRGASDAVFGDDKKPADTAAAKKDDPAAKGNPGEGKDFPKLSSVPERPKPPSEEERKALADKLVADRENARYSDEVIRRQTDETAVAPLRSGTEPAESSESGSTSGAADKAPPPPPARTASSAPPAPAATPSPPPASPPPPRAAARPPAPERIPETPPAPPDLPPAGSSAATVPQSSPRATPSASPAAPAQAQAQAPAPAPAPARSVPAVSAFPAFPTTQSLARRPVPSPRSVARLGNPSFGAPPSDIQAAMSASTPTLRHRPPPVLGGTAAGAAAGNQAPVVGGGERVAMVRFPVGSSKLDAADLRQLRNVAAAYKRQGGLVRVEGHASSRTRNLDPVRHHLVNFDVSLSRANAVARELMRQGIPADAITVVALSDTTPVYFEVMPAGEAGNRRVEVYIVN